MEASKASELHQGLIDTGGDQDASEALMKRWTESDHAFYKELRDCGNSG